MRRRAARHKSWTFPEARDAVVTSMSQLTGTVKLAHVIEASGAPRKLVVEALAELRKGGQVNHWPAFGAYGLTDKGRELAAEVDMKRQAAPVWPWQQRGETT